MSSNKSDSELRFLLEPWNFSSIIFSLDSFIFTPSPSFFVVRSFNQPKFCPNASWNPNAITFADQIVVGILPHNIFITTKNMIVVPQRESGQILIWRDNTTGNPTRKILANLSNPWSVFVTGDEQIFVDNTATNGQVDRWTLNGTRLSSTFFHHSRCSGLFVDVNNQLYCSDYNLHQVLRQSLMDPSGGLTIVAGTGDAGSTVETLNSPVGIFVTFGLDLYVADYSNHRVQLFRPGQRSGTTVAGYGSSGTTDLNEPSGVVSWIADGYLFIVDQGNNRIVGSGPNGFRCLVGCSRKCRGSRFQCNCIHPHTMSFDKWMEISLWRIGAIIEFKSLSLSAILVVSSRIRAREKKKSSFFRDCWRHRLIRMSRSFLFPLIIKKSSLWRTTNSFSNGIGSCPISKDFQRVEIRLPAMFSRRLSSESLLARGETSFSVCRKSSSNRLISIVPSLQDNSEPEDCRLKSRWTRFYCSFSLFSSWIVFDSIWINWCLTSLFPSKSRFLHQFFGQVGMQIFVFVFFSSCLSLVDWKLFDFELFGKFSSRSFESGDQFEWIIRSWSNTTVG